MENGVVARGPRGDDAVDVLEERGSGPKSPQSSADDGPEVSLILDTLATTGVTERLAGESSRDEVHARCVVVPRESVKIRVDRAGIQPSRFHLRNQVLDAEGFPLHQSHRAKSSHSRSESEVDAADACTKGKMMNMGHSISPVLGG